MSIFYQIISSTCALMYFYVGMTNGAKWTSGTLIGGRPTPHGPTSPCHMTRIHAKPPKANLHPWITFVFSFKGERSKHMDSWAHNEATDVTQACNIHYDMWGTLLEESGGANLS